MRQRDILLLQRAQISHHLQHQHEDQTDSIVFQLEQGRCALCQTPMCSTRRTSLHMSRVRSQPYHLRSMICSSTRVQTSSSTSSSPLAILVKKGEKILRGGLHSQGEHSLGLRNIGSFRRFTFVYFITVGLLCLLLSFKALVLYFNFSLYSVIVVYLIALQHFFFCAFKILLICLKYLTLVPQQDLVS